MAVRYLLDTNAVSYLADGRSKIARRRLRSLDASALVWISSITEAELLFGLARRPQAHVLQKMINLFLSGVEVLPWTHEEAVLYSRLRTALESLGKPLGPLDTLIAAHALAAAAVLVTSDKAFSQVPGLIVENWATDL